MHPVGKYAIWLVQKAGTTMYFLGKTKNLHPSEFAIGTLHTYDDWVAQIEGHEDDETDIFVVDSLHWA